MLERGVNPLGAGTPEEPVVDEEQLGALGGSKLEQLGVRGDARGKRCHLRRPWDLQAVRAVVLKAGGFEERVDLLEDLEQASGHEATIAVWRRRGVEYW